MSRYDLSFVTRLCCFISAAVGMALTIANSVLYGATACCGTAFLLLTSRFILDFVAAPLLAGFTLHRFTMAARIMFWLACAWMAIATWPPYPILLVALCIWTRTRLHEERTLGGVLPNSKSATQ